MILEFDVADLQTARYWHKWARLDGVVVIYGLLPPEWASAEVEEIPADVLTRAKRLARELDAKYDRLNISLAQDRASWRWFLDLEPFPYFVGVFRGWVDALGNDLKERLFTGEEGKHAKRIRRKRAGAR